MKKTICKVLSTAVILQAAITLTPSSASAEQQGGTEQSVNSVQQTGEWEKWWNWGGAHYDWYFKTSDGAYHKGLLEHENKLYYLNSYGAMQTGWQEIENKKYYFNIDGAARTGLHEIDGQTYYFDNNGVLKKSSFKANKTHHISQGTRKNTWVIEGDKENWYYADDNGKRKTGWLGEYNGAYNEYFYLKDGVAQQGWIKDGNTWYFLAHNGVMQTGWQEIENKKYYFNSDGAMQTGWQTIGEKKYYFNSDGAMQTGWQTIGEKKYYFNSDGAMHNGFKVIDGKTYYFYYSDGSMAKGVMKTKVKTYTFDSNGVLQTR